MAIELSIWIYWLFCLIATLIVIPNREFAYSLLSPKSSLPLDSPGEGKGYAIAQILGWGTTLLASLIYIVFTIKNVQGPYQLGDLFFFAIANGVLEQFMFIFWFLVGCYVGNQFWLDRPLAVFTCGYVSYVIYSGLIHPLFWFQVLPDHVPFVPMIGILPFMSIFWMWLLWRYRAVWSIVAMHVAIDLITIGHLHFPWFESWQIFA